MSNCGCSRAISIRMSRSNDPASGFEGPRPEALSSLTIAVMVTGPVGGTASATGGPELSIGTHPRFTSTSLPPTASV